MVPAGGPMATVYCDVVEGLAAVTVNVPVPVAPMATVDAVLVTPAGVAVVSVTV